MTTHLQPERLLRYQQALRRGGMTGRQFRELGPYAPAGYNANSFWGETIEEQIQNGLNACEADSYPWLFLPYYMSNYNPALVTVPPGITIIKEGDFGNIFVNINNTGRFLEWRVVLDENLNSGSVVSTTLNTYSRFNQSTNSVDGGFIRVSTATQNAYYYQVDGRRCLKLQHTATATPMLHYGFRTHGRTIMPVDFRDVFGATTSAISSGVPNMYATSIMGWFRKVNAGDSSTARHTIGFGDNANLTLFSATVPRIGLIGDGSGGYRFGSVNCQDGAASGDNTASDIDANSYQPSELTNANLSTNWFHVRIKMIPPTPTATSGKWEAYLNGNLVATFANTANFPRGSGGASHDYNRIEATCYQFGDTVSVQPSLYMNDIRLWLEDINA